MQLKLIADIPQRKELVIDSEELVRLFELKVLSKLQYFYFAIMCDYGQKSIASIDKEAFCKEWRIGYNDFDLLLAQLQKKGALVLKQEKYVQLQLHTTQDDDEE
ncbi:hypothetical protein WA1_18780 [Scytonema hofmannii PCC 7110]|uniref:Uncharacterized protein n=1 Tax=Scytonema hofmannii PCC 7110 TaxID=128403 RepID=A0A139XBG1_9CYAN|nr:hypothetical protein [Scytonema hofmannii]KYC42048.1 hypothetical protein WA1_18780 [Scytonema hofmannii PCC 7110]